MNTESYHTNARNMVILYRIEPGCLGPDGVDHVEDFCLVSQKYFKQVAQEGIEWQIVPRYDKSLAEFQYSVQGKKLDYAQAKQVLALRDIKLAELVEQFEDKLPLLIEKFITAKEQK